MKRHLHISRRCLRHGALIPPMLLLLLVTFSAHGEAGISLDLSLGRDQVYAGENVEAMVTLRTSGATVRNIGYPRLSAPGGAKIDFDAPTQTHDAGDDSPVTYRFTGRFVAKGPGTHQVGPATLECEVLQQAVGSAGFFGGMEPRTVSLDSPAKELKVSPLPAAGRTANFSGGVGTFRMAVRTRPDHAAAGEPLTLTTTITGLGTVADALCPELVGPGLHSYPAKAVRRTGSLVCEQVIIPAAPGQLPPLVWSFFDPSAGKYQTLSSPLPSVAGAAPQAMPPAVLPASPVPGPSAAADRDFPYRKALAVAASLAAVVALLIYARRGKGAAQAEASPVATSQLQELERALAEGDVEKFYTLLFVIIQRLVGSICTIPPDGISGVPSTLPSLSPCSEQIRTLLSRCGHVRYGRCEASMDDMKDDLSLLRALLADSPVSLM